MTEQWRQHSAIQGLLTALACLIAPQEADMKQFNEYMNANEFGLALVELAGVVNDQR